ncbi:hypothetical protein SCAR479_02221 [Seiridium cardinale]|uniref:Uncharacterized protein n=1 Tax=Seiridium cardinale TaxID=138064 RepID=A0ABR2X5B6_9PEZI
MPTININQEGYERRLLTIQSILDSHGLQFKTGANLDEQFMEMELPEKLDVVEQIADIFSAFQKTPLPHQLEDQLGGLTFDRNGQVVGGQMPILSAVHGDLKSKRLTALLNFDFSSITHPVHEFFTGLWHQGGGLRSGDDEKLHAAILSSNFATRGITRPSSIQGIEKLEKLNDLEQALCPFQLSNEVQIEELKSKSPEELEEIVKEAGNRLVDLLEELGL